MTQDAPDHVRVFDERDQLQSIPAPRAGEDVEAARLRATRSGEVSPKLGSPREPSKGETTQHQLRS
jgi:hypothetical protein